MQNPNEDTEWNDVLRAKGILPPKDNELTLEEDTVVQVSLIVEEAKGCGQVCVCDGYYPRQMPKRCTVFVFYPKFLHVSCISLRFSQGARNEVKCTISLGFPCSIDFLLSYRRSMENLQGFLLDLYEISTVLQALWVSEPPNQSGQSPTPGNHTGAELDIGELVPKSGTYRSL